MMSNHFKSSILEIADFDVIRLQRENLASWLSIIPKYGCALNELICDGISIILNSSNKSELKRNTFHAYAGTQLFPYPCRVNNATYNHLGKNFTLPKNDPPRKHSLHGLIYKKPFVVDKIDKLAGKIECSYLYNKDCLGFPFQALIKNIFQLTVNGLSITTVITNVGKERFPFGHGWHPYFKTGDNTNDWILKIPSNERFLFDDTLIPTGKAIITNKFVEENVIGSKNIDFCYKLKSEEEKPLQVVLKSPQKNLSIVLELKGYNYLQMYIPPSRKSVALEPLTCVPDALNNKIGLTTLEPNQQMTFNFKIMVFSKSNNYL